jgi:hypothetical protein
MNVTKKLSGQRMEENGTPAIEGNASPIHHRLANGAGWRHRLLPSNESQPP